MQVNELANIIQQLQNRDYRSITPDQADGGLSLDALGGNKSYVAVPRRGQSRATTSTQPRYIGPTSSAFNFSVANNTLQMMGMQDNQPHIADTALTSPMSSHCASPRLQHHAIDPLLSISKSETYHAVETYRDSIDYLYPFIPFHELTESLDQIYEHLQHTQGSPADDEASGQCCLVDYKDVQMLKLIVATALVFEGLGKSETGQLLFDSVESTLSTSVKTVEVDLKVLRALTITVTKSRP
jgi:hypothetical protein